MPDERTYGFNRDDAGALIQGIGTGASSYAEIQRISEPIWAVILDASLAVATDSKTGATSCLATVCYWSDDDEEFVESDPVEQITVWNHSESTAHAIDTFGVVKWVGHWMFFGDCSAMAAR